jgi:predicted ATPase
MDTVVTFKCFRDRRLRDTIASLRLIVAEQEHEIATLRKEVQTLTKVIINKEVTYMNQRTMAESPYLLTGGVQKVLQKN